MGSGPIDPKELLKGLDCFLGRDGEVKTMDGISKIFSLMKDSQKLVSRCIYLNILLQTRAQDILAKWLLYLSKVVFVSFKAFPGLWALPGGFCVLWVPSWVALGSPRVPFVPPEPSFPFQNNTAKLVKQLSKSSDDEGEQRSPKNPPGTPKIPRKNGNFGNPKIPLNPPGTPKIPGKKWEFWDPNTSVPGIENLPILPQSLSQGSQIPISGIPNSHLWDPKLPSAPHSPFLAAPTAPGEAPLAEKKYKPLNTAPNAAKEIKVKIIPPQPMEGLGFLDALNSAPVPGIKIKKKKKVLSPTAAKVRDALGTFWGHFGDTLSPFSEGRLREYFYFELDETERVNVNKIKDFGEAAKREMLKDRHAFETARRLSHDSMEEKVPWAYPKTLELPAPLVIPGSGSRERFTQAERVKGILQEIFLSKE
ncbi:PP1RA phosphatase, partial [Regulus satrapa]|nr:PP1RA phosphatase [Regulus satrapa]